MSEGPRCPCCPQALLLLHLHPRNRKRLPRYFHHEVLQYRIRRHRCGSSDSVPDQSDNSSLLLPCRRRNPHLSTHPFHLRIKYIHYRCRKPEDTRSLSAGKKRLLLDRKSTRLNSSHVSISY